MGLEPNTAAAGDGLVGFDAAGEVRRTVCAGLADVDAEDRVADAELPSEESAAALAEVMMATAVPIPSRTANAPIRPTCTAWPGGADLGRWVVFVAAEVRAAAVPRMPHCLSIG